MSSSDRTENQDSLPNLGENQRRILVIDDEEAVHFTFRSFLGGAMTPFGDSSVTPDEKINSTQRPLFQIDSAFSGEAGIEAVEKACRSGRPYSMAFVDLRMPGPLNGLKTITQLWQRSPALQVVICTGCAEFSWSDIIEELGQSDRLLILKKPFEKTEVLQLAYALSEKWQLARQVQYHLEMLEEMVDDRTSKIEAARQRLLNVNAELAAAKEEAEDACGSKSDFLANMSHEIRTPLTAIIGFTDLMLNSPTLELWDDWLHTIARNADHLLAVVNDILDISKIESGRMNMERISCSPIRIVSEVSSLMQVRANEKSLNLEIEFRGEIPEMISSDPMRLRQILINLVGNAIKFTNDGEVRLLVRMLDPSTEALPRISFEVIDTGIGIPEERLNQLFDNFTQADVSTTRKYGGTGLGLAISKRLAQLLGGDISVESREEKGSTFQVVIPTGTLKNVKMIEEIQDVLSLNQPRQEGAKSRDDLSNFRILLAEDTRDVQLLVAYMISEHGADVTTVEDGQSAVDHALLALEKEEPFHVVLMDMQMPVLDGYQATTLLRQQDYPLPIIAMTAHTLPTDREKCLAAGCDDYLKKPVERDELISRVAQYCRQISEPLSMA